MSPWPRNQSLSRSATAWRTARGECPGFLSAASAISSVRRPFCPPTLVRGAEPVQPQLPAELQLRIGVAKAGGGHTVRPCRSTPTSRVSSLARRRGQPAGGARSVAIAVRTYTLANRGRHRADDFDLCDETHCQVMRPADCGDRSCGSRDVRSHASGWWRAGLDLLLGLVRRTNRDSLRRSGRVPRIHRICRPGPTMGAAERRCGRPRLTAADLLRALRAGGFRGSAPARHADRVAQQLRPCCPTAARRARTVVDLRSGFAGRRRSDDGLAVHQEHGVRAERENGRYRFSGHGSGHGVGMCVIGSMRLAVAGRSADEILRRYYPGLSIGDARWLRAVAPSGRTRARPPPRNAAQPQPLRQRRLRRYPVAAPAPVFPDVSVSLPDGDEGAPRLHHGSHRARPRGPLAGARCPAPRLTLRFHPTVDSYEQATDEPWFTSAPSSTARFTCCRRRS